MRRVILKTEDGQEVDCTPPPHWLRYWIRLKVRWRFARRRPPKVWFWLWRQRIYRGWHTLRVLTDRGLMEDLRRADDQPDDEARPYDEIRR